MVCLTLDKIVSRDGLPTPNHIKLDDEGNYPVGPKRRLARFSLPEFDCQRACLRDILASRRNNSYVI